MKIFLFLFTLIIAKTICAQVPHIDYLIADEAKSQLQIHGRFSPDATVKIENLPQEIISYHDTLLICTLADSGAGSGGHIVVNQATGISNIRTLSIIKLNIDHLYWYFAGRGGFALIVGQRWNINWRADIGRRGANLPQIIPFEASKTSTGTYIPGAAPVGSSYILPWSDTSAQIQDSSISLSGTIDLDSSLINFKWARMYLSRLIAPYHFTGIVDSIYHPLSISFDTSGKIKGYIDSNHASSPSDKKKVDSLYEQEILFPPGVSSSVIHSNLLNTSSGLNVIFQNRNVFIISDKTCGETEILLYGIDGKKTEEIKINISNPGKYFVPFSKPLVGCGIIIIKTRNDVFLRKIIF
jgi:hypothetical protein